MKDTGASNNAFDRRDVTLVIACDVINNLGPRRSRLCGLAAQIDGTLPSAVDRPLTRAVPCSARHAAPGTVALGIAIKPFLIPAWSYRRPAFG